MAIDNDGNGYSLTGVDHIDLFKNIYTVFDGSNIDINFGYQLKSKDKEIQERFNTIIDSIVPNIRINLELIVNHSHKEIEILKLTLLQTAINSSVFISHRALDTLEIASIVENYTLVKQIYIKYYICSIAGQKIIFFYLLDNNEQTQKLVKEFFHFNRIKCTILNNKFKLLNKLLKIKAFIIDYKSSSPKDKGAYLLKYLLPNEQNLEYIQAVKNEYILSNNI